MSTPPSPAGGGELFIVDNSDERWKGLRYLEEWTEIARAFDIASGYFEIGALLVLDGKWQKLESIRILMGDEMTARTRQALLEGLRQRALATLDGSLEATKPENDFLGGVPAILEALRSGKIQCRVYAKRKFHAKAYITHPKFAVVGSAALVGSSNFTIPGLTQNIELNIQIRAPGDVASLQAWFEQHWADGSDVTEDIIRVLERHTAPFTPFQIYAKALQELFENEEAPTSSWEKSDSRIYPLLDEYQREGYHSLLKIARQHRGAFLCDGVGLGKTFIGLMLIERLILHDRRRVLLLVPKSGRLPVWEPQPQDPAASLYGDFSNLAVYNHTDLTREGEFPEKLARLAEMADVVIIDEAHHFRNRGLMGESRYWKLRQLIGAKTTFLLTATPVNNNLTDFQHLIELFSDPSKPDAFKPSLGIQHLPGYFQNLEKQLARVVRGEALGELFAEAAADSASVLFDDRIFKSLVVLRSRRYVRESQRLHGATDIFFPRKEAPVVAAYSIKSTYGHLLGRLEQAFAREQPLFSLALYNPLAFWRGSADEIKAWDKNRQKQVVALIRLLFLKRFESSARAFEHSCQTLLLKLLAFLKKNLATAAAEECERHAQWLAANRAILDHVAARRTEFADAEEDGAEEDDLADEFLDDVEELDRKLYDVPAIIEECYADLGVVVAFLDELKGFAPAQDNKLATLIRLLKTDKVLKKHKVLIFTEFMSTARYLRQQLVAAGIAGVGEVDSASKRDRAEIIEEFSPYYNGLSVAELAAQGRSEIRVLIATDVLAEGLNLQDATRLINYDLHWNPVRLMQRIGRVDRRLNPALEKKILAAHPTEKAVRGTVAYWNFLPPDELEELLRLYGRVSHKTLRISKVFGIEGRKLLTPQDDYDALRDFVHAYEGEETPLEKLHLEYQRLLKENPALEPFLRSLPLRIFSGRAHPAPGTRALFLCYRLPAADQTKPEAEQWNGDAFHTAWYLLDLATGEIAEDPARIAEIVRSTPDTPRTLALAPDELRQHRLKVEAHIRQTYLRRVQAPLGAAPVLKCWLELH